MNTSTLERFETPRTVEQNPIGISIETASRIISELNGHVASLAILFHQYQKHHWLVQGPQFRDLHIYLEESYREVQNNLDELAERITVLGGIPSSSPSAQVKAAYVEHEQEGAPRVREMLTNDLRMEQKIIASLRNSVRTASELGDYGSERLLKSVLYHSENRAHHLDHYLEENGLTPVVSRNGQG